MAMKLADRMAVVTGAAQGIGLEIARRFAAEGAHVALLDCNGAAAEVAAQATGHGACAFSVDVSDEDSAAQAVRAVLTDFGQIDILVNNAATQTPKGKINDIAPSDIRQAFAVNLLGVLFMCRAVLPGMIARKYGRIINVASQLGAVAAAGNAAYCASKGGVLQLTRALALDHAAQGILVNSLSPGAVLTPRILDSYGSAAAAETALAGKHPLGRLGRPQDIAGGAVFLASDDASFMTGADLVIDGGYTAQ